ncbi:MAG: PQQ-like beta-propeller repeat protein [Planctomycetales bacterium]|nr:PQQ-like beta-propeller repeat protein [bacterium]UNM06998.1 MAG: PQQ-like beta-propeller repeat protein [Planctomycetales bacterium]
MKRYTTLVLALPLLLSLALPAVSCSSGATPATPPEASAGPGNGLPAPSAVERSSSAVLELRIHSGAEFMPASSQNVTADADQAVFSLSPAGDPPLRSEICYAMYDFQLDPGTTTSKLNLNWNDAATPANGTVLAALANWDSDRWDWQPVNGPSWDFGDSAPYRRNDGLVLAVVMIATAGGGRLEWIRLGENSPPVISVVTNGDGGTAPSMISVDATASRDVDGTLADFSWDWNADGSIEHQGTAPGTDDWQCYLGGRTSLRLSATDNIGAKSELLLEFNTLAHAPWWCAGANRYQNRRSPASGPALLSATDEPAWSFDVIDGPDGILQAADGTIYTANHDGKVYAIDPDTGMEITHFDEGSGKFLRLRAIGPDGRVYALVDNGSPTADNAVLALNSDLTEDWRLLASSGVRDMHGFTMDGGLLLSYGTNELRSVDPEATSTVNWSYTTPSGLPRNIAAIGDGGQVYFGTDFSDCYALDMSGSLLDSTSANSKLLNSPVIGSTGNVMLVAGSAAYVMFCDQNCTKLGDFQLPSGNHPLSYPAIGFELDTEHLLLPGEGKIMYALNMEGLKDWSLTEDSAGPAAPIVDASEDIYVSIFKDLVCLKPNKNERWRFTYDYTTAESVVPLIMLSDGSLLIRTNGDDTIRCYRP